MPLEDMKKKFSKFLTIVTRNYALFLSCRTGNVVGNSKEAASKEQNKKGKHEHVRHVDNQGKVTKKELVQIKSMSNYKKYTTKK